MTHLPHLSSGIRPFLRRWLKALNAVRGRDLSAPRACLVRRLEGLEAIEAPNSLLGLSPTAFGVDVADLGGAAEAWDHTREQVAAETGGGGWAAWTFFGQRANTAERDVGSLNTGATAPAPEQGPTGAVPAGQVVVVADDTSGLANLLNAEALFAT